MMETRNLAHELNVRDDTFLTANQYLLILLDQKLAIGQCRFLANRFELELTILVALRLAMKHVDEQLEHYALVPTKSPDLSQEADVSLKNVDQVGDDSTIDSAY